MIVWHYKQIFNNSENINMCKKAIWRFIRSKGYIVVFGISNILVTWYEWPPLTNSTMESLWPTDKSFDLPGILLSVVYLRFGYRDADNKLMTSSKNRGDEKVWTIAMVEKLSEVWGQIGKPHCLTLQTDLTFLKI
jgi:hypothetical protein